MIRRLFGGGARRPKTHVAVEYWVYLPEPKPIPQEVLLGRLMRSSPYRLDGEPALGPAHGLLFSDIRLSMGMVIREKNAHLFRPDLFEAHIEPTESAIRALSEARGLMRVRFISELRVPDRGYLRLLPHLAESIAYYGKSPVVFDLIAERLMETEKLRESLEAAPDAERAELHLHTVWLAAEEGGKGATRGLAKLGLPELETPASPSEHRTVVCGVLGAAAEAIWENGELADETTAEFFGASFLVRVDPGKESPLKAHIMRVGGI